MPSSTSNYFYAYIRDILASGRPTAIPKEVLEREGVNMEKLNKYFFMENGPFGLVHFIRIKKIYSH